MRIFLSYGHDDYISLAKRIKRDLEAERHDVWFDATRLSPGGDWERYIEEGLNWASAIPGAGRFLLLMTPHSVRRPNGYCLNELARAFSCNLPVIPVMVSAVEPPLSICRLQWLDMKDCFPVELHELRYNEQLTKLIRALEEKLVPFEAVQQRLLNYLQPSVYADDLVPHLQRFTGRQWVMSEVNAWLASTKRAFWITGEPGIGKSALAAWLCNSRPEILAYHFCRFGNTDRTDLRRILFSLAYQLSTQLPVYHTRLNASIGDHFLEMSPLALFDRLFVSLLNNPVPITDKTHILLIDGVDEATHDGKNELSALIGTNFHRLPQWVRIIVTSRSYEKEVNFDLQALDPWKLEARSPENLRDLRDYLTGELRVYTSTGQIPVETVDVILSRSEGLFLYVNWVRQELHEGRLFLENIKDFPRGLGGVFAGFFRRHFPNPPEYASVCRPALEVICAAREPLETRELALLFDWSEYQVQALIARLASLFPVIDDRVHFFHQALKNWLTTADTSGQYYVDKVAGDQRLYDFVCKQINANGTRKSRYCVVHGAASLAARGDYDAIERLLLNFGWMEAKLQYTDVISLLADYEPPSAQSPSVRHFVSDESIRALSEALKLSAHVLAQDKTQLSSQLWGRLSPKISPHIATLLRDAAARKAPWLRSAKPTLTRPGGPLVRFLSGHRNHVTAILLSPHEQRLVSFMNEDLVVTREPWQVAKVWEAKEWEVATGREVRSFTGRELSSESSASQYTSGHPPAAVTPDGKRAVTVSWNHTMKIWDLEKSRELGALVGHTNTVDAVAVSPDGKLAISASQDNTLRLWELDSGHELRRFGNNTFYPQSLALLSGGKWAVSDWHYGKLKLWNVETDQSRIIKGCDGWVTALTVTLDGKSILAASRDTLDMWEFESGRKILALRADT